MEGLINLFTDPAVATVVGALIGFVFTNFYKKTVYFKIVNILIDAFVEILDETDLEVPIYIEKLIMKIHAVTEDTREVENILEDKKVKKFS
jgi:hypothetical protein